MARGNFGNVTPRRVSKVARRGEAFKLMQAGYTEREILLELPQYISLQQLRADLRKAMKEAERPVTEWLAVQTARYEALLRAVWQNALDGDVKAHNAALDTIRDQSKLLDLGGASDASRDNSDVAVYMNYILNETMEADADDIDDMTGD